MIKSFDEFINENSQISKEYRMVGSTAKIIDSYLAKYPKVKIAMEKFVKNKNLLKAYVNFIDYKKTEEQNFGFSEKPKIKGYEDYTHYNSDIPKDEKGIDMGFGDIFQYVYLKHNPNSVIN
jgi:hypothetical protein